MNAFAEQIGRLIPGKYPAGACPEGLDDHCRAARIKYHDNIKSRMRGTYLSRYIEARQGSFLESSANDGDIGLVLIETLANSFRVSRISHNLGPISASSQHCRYQLAA
jgi:hypothetical protein